ncbi:MAG TPA: lipid transporter [Herpetosiphon sp.]|uniref:Lipid transport protein domain n=1 Tax=Herpetosiphon aurantiacus (strain ATCC 23779 / DSM 785 / 114-95) TaxID=316274 RepID=A9AX29_HERA2|nr:HEAT repeat domain-containing protein [Herpetosiphon sp.]ABX04837.1 Lipid transport protein domain [Herpetosiphon aurantiacus DSM 785]HBW49905.1 lipid transporter [Herpetosiphon sp.]
MIYPRVKRWLSMLIGTVLLAQLVLIPHHATAQTRSSGREPVVVATESKGYYRYPDMGIYRYAWSSTVDTQSTTQTAATRPRQDVNRLGMTGVVEIERYASGRSTNLLRAKLVNPKMYTITETGWQLVTDREVVGPDFDKQVEVPFYFQQHTTGEVVGMYFDRTDSEEVRNMKRAAVSQLAMQLEYSPTPSCDDRTITCAQPYKRLETDVTGTYTAAYAARIVDSQYVEITKTRDQDSYTAFADRTIVDARDTLLSSKHTAMYDLRAGVLVRNSNQQTIRNRLGSAEQAQYAGSGYGIESGINANESISLDGVTTGALDSVISLSGDEQTSELAALMRRTEGRDYVATPLVATIVEQAAVADRGLAANDLTSALALVAQNPHDPNNVIVLRATLNTLDRSMQQLDQRLSKGTIATNLYEPLIGALTGVIDPQAQALVIKHFIQSPSVAASIRTQALTALTIFKKPSLETIRFVTTLADQNTPEGMQALLVLGAIAGTIQHEQPAQARDLATIIEATLTHAKSDTERDLALRALGNAGTATDLAVIRPYLADANQIVRTSAIDALRKFPAADTNALLNTAYRSDTSEIVRHTARELLYANGDSPSLNAFDWNWQQFIGGGDLKGELKSRVYVSDGPDITALARGEAKAHAWSWSYTLAEAQASTYVQTEHSIKYRYFEAYVKVLGNNVFTPIKERLQCGVERTGNLYQTTINFFSLTKTFMVGPVPVQLGLTASGTISIPWKIVASACDVPISANANISITPTVWASASATAAVTIFVARGGVGITADFLKTGIEAKASASYHIINGFHGSINLNVSLQPMAVRIFLWYQLRKLNGSWKPRNEWTLWNWSAPTQTWPIWNHSF